MSIKKEVEANGYEIIIRTPETTTNTTFYHQFSSTMMDLKQEVENWSTSTPIKREQNLEENQIPLDQEKDLSSQLSSSRTSTSSSESRRHDDNRHQILVYKCRGCPEQFNTLDMFVAHRRKHAIETEILYKWLAKKRCNQHKVIGNPRRSLVIRGITKSTPSKYNA